MCVYLCNMIGIFFYLSNYFTRNFEKEQNTKLELNSKQVITET